MDDFSELEAELKKLRPRPVSDGLVARVERALATQGESAPTAGFLPRPKASQGWWTLGLGLTAATALLLIGLTLFNQPAPPPEPVLAQTATPTPAGLTSIGLKPSTLTRVVYHQRDEGLIFSPNQSERLLRRVRYDTRETMQWRNPQTGASLRVSYPAEQVVLTPVSFQ
ncbi:MAG: hypothetical protein M3Q46_04230 [Verrucomicrobiota bacterium]|nr:hypothetical protein [Verrucomicrobiota bacterium]